MGSNRLRPLEKIARDFAVKMGVIEEGGGRLPAALDSAVYYFRLDVKEYILEEIGDDMSPAAQRLRAKARRM